MEKGDQRATVKMWVAEFKCDRESLEDDPALVDPEVQVVTKTRVGYMPCHEWSTLELIAHELDISTGTVDIMKPVCNDHLYNKIYYPWFIQ